MRDQARRLATAAHERPARRLARQENDPLMQLLLQRQTPTLSSSAFLRFDRTSTTSIDLSIFLRSLKTSVCLKMWSFAARRAGSTGHSILPSCAPALWLRLSGRAVSNTSAAAQAPAASTSTSEPYFITEAVTDTVRAPPSKWGRATIKSIRGHTKKLNPLARQVRSFCNCNCICILQLPARVL